MKTYLTAIILLFTVNMVATLAYAHDEHTKIINQTQTINQIQYNGAALAIAAGQHHYRTTNSLKWSIGVGHVKDSSAISFGIGKQIGKVFITGNASSDGRTAAIGFGIGGSF